MRISNAHGGAKEFSKGERGGTKNRGLSKRRPASVLRIFRIRDGMKTVNVVIARVLYGNKIFNNSTPDPFAAKETGGSDAGCRPLCRRWNKNNTVAVADRKKILSD